MVFSVLLLLYRESLSIKNPTENLARELHRWANEHAPRGGGVQRQRADFFSRRSADPHYSREKVGATRHGGVGMWVKAAWRGGGRYWDFLHQSVSFLLVAFRYCMNTWPQHWDQRRRQSVWNMTARKLFHLLVRGKMFRWGTHLLSLQMSPNRVYLFFFRDVRVSIYTSRCF